MSKTNKMTDFDFNFDRSSNEAITDRLDFYICTNTDVLDGVQDIDEDDLKKLKWVYLGIFDDESSFEVTKEKFEYKNNGKDFISNYTDQSFMIKGSLLNAGNIYARAFAFGRDPSEVDISVNPLEYQLDMSELRAVAPYFALRACGRRQDGKYFVHELARAQVVTSSITESLTGKDIAKLPVEIKAYEDPDAKLGFSVYRYRVEK